MKDDWIRYGGQVADWAHGTWALWAELTCEMDVRGDEPRLRAIMESIEDEPYEALFATEPNGQASNGQGKGADTW